MKAIDKSIIRIRAEDAQAAALWTLRLDFAFRDSSAIGHALWRRP